MESNKNKVNTEIPKEERKTSIVWAQIIIGVASGAIIGIGGTVFYLNGKMERLDEQIQNLKERLPTNVPIDQSTPNIDSASKADPVRLQVIIKGQQSQNVKTSYSETNCFTDANLATFKQNRKQDQIVNELMNDNSFIDLIISIKKMSPSARQALLESSKKIAKPTWGELGAITSKGQTEAGRQAELLIANAIVYKITDMIELSIDELRKNYK